MIKILILTCFTILCGCSSTSTSTNNSSSSLVPKEIYQKTNSAIFEVVVPKTAEDESIKYARPLPLDRQSFRQRNEKYYSIGTAFAIAQNKFVSAAHVFTLHLQKPWNDFYLRNQAGQVFKIKNILKYSSYRDVVVFDLEETPKELVPLAVSTKSEIADTIFVVGNALGEGISFRAGQISLYTPEEINNAWKFIRFSAPASPGNSGGPLLDEKGEVIGVVLRKSQSENLNFAVPMAEVTQLSESKADFSFFNLKLNRQHIHENIKLHFEIPIPNTPAQVSLLSERAYADFYSKEILKLYETKDVRFFPNNPEFKEYLRNQPHLVGVGFVTSDSSGSNWKIHYAKPSTENLTPDEQIQTFRSGSWAVLSIDKPKSQSLKSFVLDAQLIMEKSLKVLKVNRPFADDSIPIQSFGKPTQTKEWSDEIGRPWVKYSWNVPLLDTYFTLNCLPTPKGVVCNVSYYPIEFIGSIPEILDQRFAQELLISYSGTVKEWKDYFALDQKWIPNFFKQAAVNLTPGSELQFSTETMTAAIKNKKVDEKSFLIARIQYSLNDKISLEIQGLQIDPDKEDKNYFTLTSVTEPANKSSSSSKNTWKYAKSRSGEFDGKAHTKNDMVTINLPYDMTPKGSTPRKIYYTHCGSDVDSPKQNLIKSCNEFHALSRY